MTIVQTSSTPHRDAVQCGEFGASKKRLSSLHMDYNSIYCRLVHGSPENMDILSATVERMSTVQDGCLSENK